MSKREVPVYIGPEEFAANVSYQKDNDSKIFGVEPIASFDPQALRGLALKVWKVDADRMRFINFIVVQKIKSLNVDGTTVYYAAAEAYRGR